MNVPRNKATTRGGGLSWKTYRGARGKFFTTPERHQHPVLWAWLDFSSPLRLSNTLHLR